MTPFQQRAAAAQQRWVLAGADQADGAALALAIFMATAAIEAAQSLGVVEESFIQRACDQALCLLREGGVQ